MTTHFQLLKILADGSFHSGETLGASLGVSRAAVWKSIQALTLIGCDVHAVRGKGYRLAEPLELLDSNAIRSSLGPVSQSLLQHLEIKGEIDSTNRYLMSQPAAVSGSVCLAESQTAGRGRRGRDWISPFGRNIYMSVVWRYDEGPARLSGLSLAVAVAVVRALEAAGIEQAAVKWPNDIFLGGGKVGGILLEVAGESNGPCRVVVGIGLNIGMGLDAGRGIDQSWEDVKRIRPDVGRNRLAGGILQELLPLLDGFAQHGFAPLRKEWSRSDLMFGKAVVVQRMDGPLHGRALGVDDSGALLLETGAGVERIQSGEVSLRPAGDQAR